jgi:hypothetical protein
MDDPTKIGPRRVDFDPRAIAAPPRPVSIESQIADRIRQLETYLAGVDAAKAELAKLQHMRDAAEDYESHAAQRIREQQGDG